MHSRAYLLLKRDLENLRRFPMEGISAEPVSELNMLQWSARLCGLPDTPWEGGVFHLHLQFTGDFNSVPPTVQFVTIPFHPNIHPTEGSPHCHLLSPGGWSEAVSVPVLLISLQALLSSPELDHSVHSLATELFQRAPHTYRQMARDCITASLRYDAGLTPYDEADVAVTVAQSVSSSHSVPRLPALQPHLVSFDDYLNLWRDIATSKPPAQSLSPAGRRSAGRRSAGSLYEGDRRAGDRFRGSKSGEASMELKLKQHHLLQHGQGGRELSTSLLRQQRMERLRQTYMDQHSREEKDEEEAVDELLHWTKTLDGTVLSTPNSLKTPL